MDIFSVRSNTQTAARQLKTLNALHHPCMHDAVLVFQIATARLWLHLLLTAVHVDIDAGRCS
jgi:hypothetical protein